MGLMDFLKRKRDDEPKMTQELWMSIVAPVIFGSYDDLVAAVGRKPDAEGISQLGAMSNDGSTEYVWKFGCASGTANLDKEGKVKGIGYYPQNYTTIPKGTDPLAAMFNGVFDAQKPK